MNLKLGLCVLFLNLLILMVAYEVEARKMAEGNMQDKRLNFPLDQVRITSYGNLQNKDTFSSFWISNNQANEEYAQVHLSSYGDLQNKYHPQKFRLYKNQGDNNRQQANEEYAQVHLSSYGDLQNKYDTQKFRWYKNQGDNNYKQAKEEHAQVHLSSYGDMQNKDETQNSWIHNNQGDNYHQHAKEEYAQAHVTSYGDLKNKNGIPKFWINDNEWESDHQRAKEENADIHSSSHMEHIDPFLRVFFLMDDLKLRKQMTISFPRRDLSLFPSFLPKEEADLIPFSLKELPDILQRFSSSGNSLQVKGMEDTLRVCEAPPIKGETKYCATSAEAMVDFVQEIIGEKIQIEALSTKHFSNSTPILQKYTMLDNLQEVSAPKMVACHTMPYAYAVFYCHYTISKSKVFKVSLGGENGDRVDAIAVCHLDTSEWSPSHVSFHLLGISPGTTPICHFFPSDNIVWVPKIATAQVI